jgi:hypothetical protein
MTGRSEFLTDEKVFKLIIYLLINNWDRYEKPHKMNVVWLQIITLKRSTMLYLNFK